MRIWPTQQLRGLWAVREGTKSNGDAYDRTQGQFGCACARCYRGFFGAFVVLPAGFGVAGL